MRLFEMESVVNHGSAFITPIAILAEHFATLQIIAWYRATNHPDVRRGFKTSAEVRQDFLQTLSDVMKTEAHSNRGAMVSFPSFLDFYCSLTAFTSDGDFR